LCLPYFFLRGEPQSGIFRPIWHC